MDKKLKEIFFSQYYGQKIFKVSSSAAVFQENTEYFWNASNNSGFITLNHISKISDEEAKNVLKILNDNSITYEFVSVARGITDVQFDCGGLLLIIHFEDSCIELYSKSVNNYLHVASSGMLRVYQYLQSIGYALPFREFNIDELVENNLLKLEY